MPLEYNTILLQLLQERAVAQDLERLENSDCIQTYGLSIAQESPYGNLLVVTSLELNDTAIAVDYHDAESEVHNGAWLCDGDGYQAGYVDADLTGDGVLDSNTDRGMMRSTEAVECSNPEAVLANARTWTIDEEQWIGTRFGSPEVGFSGGPVVNISAPVTYCLAEPYTPRCAVGLHTTLLTIVAAFNAVKIIAMLVCVLWTFEPLATSGDAISSFLAIPELQSGGQGPLSVNDVRKTRSASMQSLGARKFQGKRLRWMSAACQGPRFFSRWMLFLYT